MLSRYVTNLIFFFKFPFFYFSFSNRSQKRVCGLGVVDKEKSKLMKIKKLKEEFIKLFMGVRNYLLQKFNKYQLITIFTERYKKMKFIKKFKYIYYV